MGNLTAKREGLGLDIKSFTGDSGREYIVFRTLGGSYHVFAEVEAKEAARDCGSKNDGNTRQQWASIWPETAE